MAPAHDSDESVVDITDGQGSGLSFSIVPIPNKGHGCRASRVIRRGERIIAETPLVRQGPGHQPLQQVVDKLSRAERVKFFELTQNVVRFGTAPSARGIFATNAHPCHDFSVLHRGIFPTIARFNHACDASAVYRWNSALDRLTVHATRDIQPGEEICVTYSFADGLLREQRQRHLLQTFGFRCDCRKCALQGAALAESEARLRALGDVNSCVHDLWQAACATEGSFLRGVAKNAPSSFLDQIEERYRLIQEEFAGFHADGIECFLQAFVELCERAALKLVSARDKEGGRVGASPAELQLKAEAYAEAARKWAQLAMEATRVLKGSDNPAFLEWSSAHKAGVWDLSGGTFDFHARWVRAGLARHSFCHRELA